MKRRVGLPASWRWLVPLVACPLLVWTANYVLAPSRLNAPRGAGVTRPLLPDTIRLVFDPDLDPSGSRVAFVGYTSETDHSLFVLDLRTGAVAAVLPERERFLVSRPHWSADGTAMVFAGESILQQKDGLWQVHLDSGDVDYLGPGHEGVRSPDGVQLARFNTDRGVEQLVIVDLATTDARPLYAVETANGLPLGGLEWSAHGEALAFVQAVQVGDKAVQQIVRLDVKTGRTLELVRSAQLHSLADPTWILNDEWIVYLAGTPTAGTLQFVSKDGRCTVSPLPGLDSLNSIDISPDGTTAVAESFGRLYLLDLPEMLAPNSLGELLVCE